MKRVIALILALGIAVSLAGCGSKPEQTLPTTQPTVATTEAPTETTSVPTEPTEPDWERGIIRAEGLGILWRLYQRGDTVTVIGSWEEYYVIQDGTADHLVPMGLIRLEGEEPWEEQTGYARYGTQVYSSAYLAGDAAATLIQNTKVQVLDSKDEWMYIQWAEGSGYVSAGRISRWPISSGGGSSNDGGYGGGGGSSGGGGGGSQDGSDVNLGDLAFFGGDYRVQLLGTYVGPGYEKMEPTGGTVLSDGTEGNLAILAREAEVKVTEVSEEACIIYMEGLSAKLPRWAVRLEGEDAYAPWEAYSIYGTKAYLEYRCKTEQTMFYTNQRVKVVDALTEAGLYVIELEDGTICYTAMDGLREKPIYQGGKSSEDGGSYSGGDSGSSGGEWTPPVL